jgi:hypothetical protein
MPEFKKHLIPLLLLFIPLYPKFPLLGLSETFVAIRLEDILVAAVVLIYAVGVARSKFRKLNDPLVRSILLFWFIGFVASFSGIFLTKTAGLNLGILHAVRRVEYMSLFLIAYDWLSNTQQLRYYIRTLLLVGTLVAVYGLGQQFFHFPVISTTNSEFAKGLALTLGEGARINSTFAGHYDLAAFCLLPLLLIIALLPISRNRGLLLVSGGLIYWAMLLSASRITFASFIISSSLLVILIRKKAWLFPLMIVSLMGFMLSPQLRGRYLDLVTNHLKITMAAPVSAQMSETVVVATPESKAVDQIPDALKEPVVAEDRSFNIRIQAEWPRAIRAFLKNPLVGSGYSSIGLAVDNEYLRILAETGILGLSAFFLIVLRYFKTTIPVILHYRQDLNYAFIIAAFCFLISLLLGGLFIDVFAASKIAMVLWSIIGLSEKAKSFIK